MNTPLPEEDTAMLNVQSAFVKADEALEVYLEAMKEVKHEMAGLTMGEQSDSLDLYLRVALHHAERIEDSLL